jgi:hypothetical protein
MGQCPIGRQKIWFLEFTQWPVGDWEGMVGEQIRAAGGGGAIPMGFWRRIWGEEVEEKTLRTWWGQSMLSTGLRMTCVMPAWRRRISSPARWLSSPPCVSCLDLVSCLTWSRSSSHCLVSYILLSFYHSICSILLFTANRWDWQPLPWSHYHPFEPFPNTARQRQINEWVSEELNDRISGTNLIVSNYKDTHVNLSSQSPYLLIAPMCPL